MLNMKIRWAVAALLTILTSSGCSDAASPSLTPAAVRTEEKVIVGNFTQEKVLTFKYAIPDTFKRFFAESEPGPFIPGLKQGLVPQGLAYYAERNWLIVSSYRNDGAPSVLFIIDFATNKLVKSLLLYDNSLLPYKGHAGGIAVSSRHLWVGGENLVRALPLEALVKAGDGSKVSFSSSFRPETKASFVSYSDGVLWVGDYFNATKDPSHTTDRHKQKTTDNKEYNAWAVGYRLDPGTDNIPKYAPVDDKRTVPDLILSIPDKIQGFVIHRGQVVLSQSAGTTNPSYLLKYRDFRKEPESASVTLGGRVVPIWILDGSKQADRLAMPPMSEGVDVMRDRLVVLFESAAEPYRRAANYLVDQLIYLN
jgi:hypothetical protein